MGVRMKGSKFYIAFRWKHHRMDTATSATSKAEAQKVEKAVKNAFRINRFDHLEPASLEVVMKIFQNKGWALPADLVSFEPREELTLLSAISDYLKANGRHRTGRNLYAIDRLVEYFGESTPLKDFKVAQIRSYRERRQETVENGTINREISVLSGIFRVQIEQEKLDLNPCLMLKRLPENERETYLSWEDFQRFLQNSWWIRDMLIMLYYTGMRFGEVAHLRWEMFRPERRMLILPPESTKEGKSENKATLRPKRIPLRKEPFDLLMELRNRGGEKVVKAAGPVFTYVGRYKNHCGTYQGKPITYGMCRKAWRLAVQAVGIEGLQIKDLRHTWKTNALESKIDPSVRDGIVGHSSHRTVSERYYRLSDKVLLDAVDSMSFDHGWTELNSVAGIPENGCHEKSDANLTPILAKTEKNQSNTDVPLDKKGYLSVVSENLGG